MSSHRVHRLKTSAKKNGGEEWRLNGLEATVTLTSIACLPRNLSLKKKWNDIRHHCMLVLLRRLSYKCFTYEHHLHYYSRLVNRTFGSDSNYSLTRVSCG